MVLQEIFNIPPLTRVIIISSVILSYATYIQYLKPSNLYLNYKLAFSDQFQPWRTVTSILYFGDLDLITVMHLIFFQQISSYLESHTFLGFANYLYYLILNFITITVIGLWLNEHSLTDYFVESLMYVWGRQNQERQLLFMFVIQVKAQYITWIFIFLNIISGRSIQSNLIGALIGHTYYYFAFIVPKLHRFKGKQLLATPKFLQDQFTKLERTFADTLRENEL
ncbi:unnamed protein product (macronuclear) [Paramecium tetraurelia]|uniref:Derlin n=1 Tax=Paramecium tetraurelia TaxID=5888 RepID=A0C3Q9_PARTE|nr:uncharacterized protein GSPATT00034905001 [Paramecium tetraurelia]CAK65426.1 unnamed protein product [Paramecium tetraurelia]|eukprot:XP_001432823.1 hypothetical protein (macronuclear) [Paramecium tetraurelia strain d4-2]